MQQQPTATQTWAASVPMDLSEAIKAAVGPAPLAPQPVPVAVTAAAASKQQQRLCQPQSSCSPATQKTWSKARALEGSNGDINCT